MTCRRCRPIAVAFGPLLLLSSLLAATGAQAADATDYLNQKLWVQIGAFRPSISSHIQVDRSNSGAAGTDLHLEDELGLAEHKTLGTLLVGARFGDRWRAEFEYFSLKRSADKTLLETEIVVDDTTFPVSASVDSEFDSKVARASVGYSFYKTDEAEAGAVAGLHVTRFKFVVEGLGQVDGSTVAVRREEAAHTVPLPTIGVYGTYAFAPSWLASGRADAFAIDYKGYKGRLLNFQANVQYRFTGNFALGVGYRYDQYKLNETRRDPRGELRYTFQGPQVFIDAGF